MNDVSTGRFASSSQLSGPSNNRNSYTGSSLYIRMLTSTASQAMLWMAHRMDTNLGVSSQPADCRVSFSLRSVTRRSYKLRRFPSMEI